MLIQFFYNVLFTLGFPFVVPFYFLKMLRRGNWRAGFGERFGRYTDEFRRTVSGKRIIWFHAVSVGEVNVCTELIRQMKPEFPEFHFLVTTTTSTGMGRLRKELPEDVLKMYYPMDHWVFVLSALKTVRPEAVVLVEAEIWPNFLWQLARRDIPAFLVNARLSDRSHRGYKKHRWLFGPIFGSFAGVGAQNKEDAERLADIGYPREVIQTPGVLKFDTANVNAKGALDIPAMLAQLGVKPGAPILVAGSTHDGEELMLAEIADRLRKDSPDLFLVLVPRHFERGPKLGEQLKEQGVNLVLRSDLTPETKYAPGEIDCLVVNTTGELTQFYQHATVAFVGKSVTAKGGQNPIEPGFFGKAMIFGPNMQNFRYIAAAFVDGGGAAQVADARALEVGLAKLLANETYRSELGENALAVVKANQGAVQRTVKMLREKLAKDSPKE